MGLFFESIAKIIVFYGRQRTPGGVHAKSARRRSFLGWSKIQNWTHEKKNGGGNLGWDGGLEGLGRPGWPAEAMGQGLRQAGDLGRQVGVKVGGGWRLGDERRRWVGRGRATKVITCQIRMVISALNASRVACIFALEPTKKRLVRIS